MEKEPQIKSTTQMMKAATVAPETETLIFGWGEKTALAAVISFMAIIIALGSLGNILAIIAIIETKKLRTISNTFVANLSICDLMFVTIVLPVNMYTYLGVRWQIPENACKFIGFLSYTLTGTTIITITLIAWNRYKLVVDLSHYKKIFRPRYMIVMLITTWVAPIVCLQPAVFGRWGHFGYVPVLSSCNLGLDNSSQSFKIFLLIVRAAIPCGLIIYFYSAIYATTRASHQRIDNLTSSTNTLMRQHNQRREMRLTRMMIGIFVVFVLSYFPCTISSVIDWSRPLSKIFHMFCQTSVFLGSAINPLLYGYMNEQFRNAYYHILTCRILMRWCHKDKPGQEQLEHIDNNNEENISHNKSDSQSCKRCLPYSPRRNKFYLKCDETSQLSSPRKESWNEPGQRTMVHSETLTTNLTAYSNHSAANIFNSCENQDDFEAMCQLVPNVTITEAGVIKCTV